MPAQREMPDDAVAAPSDAELLDQLDRHLRAADVVLAGLAEDMAAAGARTASERAERARAELQAARELGARLRREEPPART
jgi:hypothetical protein